MMQSELIARLPQLAGIEQRAAAALLERFALPEATRALLAMVMPYVQATRAAVQYLLLQPGKGLRPALAYAVAQACAASGGTAGVEAVALAAEMIHVGSLLHDDIVDGASLRRGVAAAHIAFDPTTAVLSGDVLVGAALRLVAEDCGPGAMRATGRAFYLLASAQAHETALRGQLATLEQARSIARGKTGALFAWICLAAASESGDTERSEDWWRWGEALGIAFQMADDLNDRRGLREGKDVGLDAQRQTPSLVDTLLAGDPAGDSLQVELAHWMELVLAPPASGPLLQLAIGAVVDRVQPLLRSAA